MINLFMIYSNQRNNIEIVNYQINQLININVKYKEKNL